MIWIFNKGKCDGIESRLSYKIFSTLKFIYSEKATKCCEISTNYLTVSTYDKWLVEVSQNFVAFSEYMNFMTKIYCSFTGTLQCENYKSDWFCQFVQRFRNIFAEAWGHCNYNWFWVLQKYNYSGWKIHQCSCQTELRKDFEHFK